jgi:hypothetical protein
MCIWTRFTCATALIPLTNRMAKAAVEKMTFFVFMFFPQSTMIRPRSMFMPHVKLNVPFFRGVNVTVTG